MRRFQYLGYRSAQTVRNRLQSISIDQRHGVALAQPQRAAVEERMPRRLAELVHRADIAADAPQGGQGFGDATRAAEQRYAFHVHASHHFVKRAPATQTAASQRFAAAAMRRPHGAGQTFALGGRQRTGSDKDHVAFFAGLQRIENPIQRPFAVERLLRQVGRVGGAGPTRQQGLDLPSQHR